MAIEMGIIVLREEEEEEEMEMRLMLSCTRRVFRSPLRAEIFSNRANIASACFCQRTMA